MTKPAIDTKQIDARSLDRKPFPGKPRYRIWVTKQAHDTVWKHADETAGEENEVGGVLIGDVFVDAEGPYLEISAAIVAEHAQHEGTQLTFTFETWDAIHKEKERLYPKEKIVGWYHTHPRFGVFLSRKDVFIQQGFFNHPWQTALVIDPVQGTEGFFVWSDGESVLCDDYWVDGERRGKDWAEKGRREPAAEPGSEEETDAAKSESHAGGSLMPWVAMTCLVALVAYFSFREWRTGQMLSELSRLAGAQHAELSRARGEVAVLLAASSASETIPSADARDRLGQIALHLNRADQVAVAVERSFAPPHAAGAPEGDAPPASAGGTASPGLENGEGNP